MPDLAFWGSGSGQFFPRYTFEDRAANSDLLSVLDDDGTPYRRIDNVTEEILSDYQKSFGGGVTKDDIFFYLYGILHSSDYRGQFEGDLKKMLPRIPKSKDFRAFSDAGRKLSALHLNYETVELYPLDEHRGVNASFRVENMKYAKTGRVADKTTVIYNSEITIFGIPEEAHEYMLGSRSAIDWIIERYQVKTDKASGIINDPNDWADGQGNPRYILDLLARIVTVSVETVRIVNALPSLDILDA
jgi:predicted helicase